MSAPREIWMDDWYAAIQFSGPQTDKAVKYILASDAEAREARLREERDRLWEALRDIANGCSFPADDVQRAIRDRARAALVFTPALAAPAQREG